MARRRPQKAELTSFETKVGNEHFRTKRDFFAFRSWIDVWYRLCDFSVMTTGSNIVFIAAFFLSLLSWSKVHIEDPNEIIVHRLQP